MNANAAEHPALNILTKILRVLWIGEYRAAFLRTRVAASTEHDAILAGLPFDTVVDLGANRGQFALCARRLFPAARIFGFEPLPGPASTWRRVFAHDARATLFEAAVGEQAGLGQMYVSRWDVSSSLLPIGQAQQYHFPFTQEARRQSVTVVRLADRLNRADIAGRALLKLDVQGSELPALRGSEELLERFACVYVETSFIELYTGQALAGDIVQYLGSRGFCLSCVANLSYGKSSRPIQADFLFTRG